MGLPAARVGDPHLCPMFDGPKPHVGGPVLPVGAVPNVWIGGMMAATVGTMCTCVSAPDSIMMGSPTVYIGGRMAARMLDPTVHGGRIIFGCLTVWIGDSGAASPLAAFFNGLLNDLFDGLKAIVDPLVWFAEGVLQGVASALKGTISGILNLAQEILTDPLKVLERTANFLQKLTPAYWVAKLITDPQMRADLGQWLSDQTKKETWEHYGDVAKKAYDTWQQLTPKEKWTAAGDITGKALEFAAEIVVLDGATKALGAAGEVAKGEEAIAEVGELGEAVTPVTEEMADKAFKNDILAKIDQSGVNLWEEPRIYYQGDPSKVIVIGRNQAERVNVVADHLGAEKWNKNELLSDAENLANNRAWIEGKIADGYSVVDIGLDPKHATKGSLEKGPYYGMETETVERIFKTKP